MHPHKWSRSFVLTILFISLIIMITNYIVNPYNVFRPNTTSQFNRLKTEFMSERMTFFYEMQYVRPQTLMVGTSRIGYFKSSLLNQYTPAPVFNLSLSGSSIYEQRRYIDYAIDHLPIKTIVWSLDFFSFNPVKHPSPSFYEERLNHPYYFNDYVVSLLHYRTFERSLKTLKINRKKGPFAQNVSPFFEQHHYQDVQGQTLSPEAVRKNVNWTLHEYSSRKDFLGAPEFSVPTSIDSKIAEVAYIIERCKSKNIQCFIYTSPVYREHLDMIYTLKLGKTYEHWKISLANITSYWDFNTYNSVTENIMNFRDSSHAVSDNGKHIFQKVFNAHPFSSPSDFGYYATRHNVHEHINQQRKFIKPFHFQTEFPDFIERAKESP
jgi:hypothetical protein